MMNNKRALIAVTATIGALALPGLSIVAQQPSDDEPPEMGFFITSVGIGDGGNLGGLAGADAHCQALADAAFVVLGTGMPQFERGAGHRTWRAYLSTQGAGAVNARDRIGSGPWANAEGLIMATSVEHLHYDNANFNWEHTLDENGNQFASREGGAAGPPSGLEREDGVNFTEHDVLTGSQIDGTAFPPGEDHTCNNWTSNDASSAWVGHADRYAFSITAVEVDPDTGRTPGSAWNSSHGTPGCTQENLVSVGGAGLLYCFATD